MPDLRKDPIVGRWVIIATDRAKRPHDYQRPPAPQVVGGFCPFCPGNESHTPPEILAFREPGTAANQTGWRVRVIPNKFPALQIEGDLEKRGDGIFDLMNGVGAHEVIIESPAHESSMARLPVDAIREVLWMYRDRLSDLQRDKRFVHGLVFKNSGAAAGASLEHCHSQLIVVPIVPITIAEELRGSLEFYKYRDRCIFCDMLRQEVDQRERVVLETDEFVAFCPFASRFPFETWIVPKRHSSHFETTSRESLAAMAVVLQGVLRKLERALDNPPYNYMLHTAPFGSADLPHYHWHLEIIPRVTGIAGFEWGSGFYINSVLPEQAGAILRETEVELGAALPSRGTGS